MVKMGATIAALRSIGALVRKINAPAAQQCALTVSLRRTPTKEICMAVCMHEYMGIVLK